MNFMCCSKFLISSCIKLDLVVLDNVVLSWIMWFWMWLPISCMVWLVWLLLLFLLFHLFSSVLCLCITPIFLKYYCPHIDFFVLCNCPIHQLACIQLDMSNLPYCFELDIVGLSIFLGYLLHLWLSY